MKSYSFRTFCAFACLLTLLSLPGCEASADSDPGNDVSADSTAAPDVTEPGDTTIPTGAGGLNATINGVAMSFNETLLATIYVDQTGTQGETTLQGLSAKAAGSLVGAALDLRMPAMVSGTYDCTLKYTGEIQSASVPYDKFNTSSGGTCTATIVITGTTGGSVSGTFEATGPAGTPFSITNGTFGTAIDLYNAPPG